MWYMAKNLKIFANSSFKVSNQYEEDKWNSFWFDDLSGPPRVSQSGVELENFFECDFKASEDAYGSYKPYGKVRLKFGPF